MRIMSAIPSPIADVLCAQGFKTAGAVLARPEVIPGAFRALGVTQPGERPSQILEGCEREAKGAWGTSTSALDLLKISHARPPIQLPCNGLNRILGQALQPAGGIIELCGLPGTGKTQLCMQMCAASQFAGAEGSTITEPYEAVYIDAEGSFVPSRYAEVLQGQLQHLSSAKTSQLAQPEVLLEAAMQRLHVCRTYDATEMYASLKHLATFLRKHPRVKAIVVDSLAFFFRHEFADDMAKRARILTDIGMTLRSYGSEFNMLIIVTNHMTTKFDKNLGDASEGWLAPALGDTWAHQPNTQLRVERIPASGTSQVAGRATLTKSAVQAVGQSCSYAITDRGVQDWAEAPQVRL